MKKVLLTGASGFIGFHCIPFLQEHGFQIHAVSSQDYSNDYTKNMVWHRADLHDCLQVHRLVEEVKPQYILHLAWEVTPGVYKSSLDNERWVRSSLELYHAFILAGGKRALMAGTCAEYDWNYGYCSEKHTPLKPSTLYGTCKNALQSVFTAVGNDVGISTSWARIFFLYGPREHENRLVSSVIKAMIMDEDAACTHGEQVRDYLYVKDAASALVALLDSNVEGPVNIASGKPVYVREIINTIADITGQHDLVKLGAIKPEFEESTLILADIERLKKEVGWQPQFDLKDGIKETIAWWKETIL